MAYTFNNLLTFDGLISAMYFWLTLAFADSFSPGEPLSLVRGSAALSRSEMAIAALVVVAVVVGAMWVVNAPGYTRAHLS